MRDPSSNTGGQHLCFIGSGQDEEDRYVNMVVASFLQKYQKYVSIVYGGFDAIHDYVKSKSELKDSFDKYIVDHNEELCKACCSRSPEAFERFKANAAAAAASKIQQSGSGSFSLGSAQSLFASTAGFFKGDKSASSALSKFTASNPQATATAQQLALSGVSMLDKFTTAFVSKSSVFKDRLVETLNNTNLPTSAMAAAGSQATRSHVSSQDRLGPRYVGGGSFRNDELVSEGGLLSRQSSIDESSAGEIQEGPCQEIQIDQWQRENDIMAMYKCLQIKGTTKYPGYIGLNKTHLWVLREIPHNKGFASIAAKRPLNMVVQITSKRRQPDFIIFRYGYAGNKSSQSGAPSPDNQQTEISKSSGEQLDDQAQAESLKEPEPKQLPSKTLPTIIASDHLHIPQAFEVIRLIKREIVRIMDEASRANDAVTKKEETVDEDSNDAAEKGAIIASPDEIPTASEKQANESTPAETKNSEDDKQ